MNFLTPICLSLCHFYAWVLHPSTLTSFTLVDVPHAAFLVLHCLPVDVPPGKQEVLQASCCSRQQDSRFIPSASSFSSRFTSSFTSQLISIIIPTLVIHHSFTLSLQAQNLPFQQILPTVFLLPTGLPHDNGTGPDLSRSSFCF